MFYLYVDIRFFPQLSRIDPAFMSGLLAGLDEALAGANGRPLSSQPPLLYAFDDAVPGAALQVSQAAHSAFERLRSSAERLAGYSICLERFEAADADEAIRAFKAMRFPPETADSFVLGPAARPSFEEYFSVSDDAFPGKVTDFTFTHPLSSDENQTFWERSSLMDAILRAVDPALRGESADKLILFALSRQCSPARCIERALRPFSGPYPPVLVRPRPEAANPYAPAVAALSRADLAVAHGRLGRTERAAFDSSRSAFDYLAASPRQRVIPDEVVRRFGVFLGLFLTGLARDRRARNHEPFIFVEDADRLPASCSRLLSRIFAEFCGESSPLVLITCEDPSLVCLEGFVRAELPVDLAASMADEARAYASSLAAEAPRTASPEDFAAEYPDRPLALYHALLSGRISRNPTRAFLTLQPAELVEMLYTAHLASGVLERRLLDDFFQESGIRPRTQAIAFQQLFRMGLVLSEESREPSLPETMVDIEITLGERARSVRERFDSFLERQAGRGLMRRWLPGPRERAQISPTAAAEALSSSLSVCTAWDESTAADFSKAIRGMAASAPISGESTCLESWTAFERAALKRSPEGMRSALAALDRTHPDEDCAFHGQRFLCRAVSSLALEGPRECLPWAKRAMMAFQAGGGRGEAASGRTLGLQALRSGQFLDAMDYLGNSRAVAGEVGDELESALSSYYEGLTFYLYGNLSRALRLALLSRAHAERAFRPDWEIQARILSARIHLDLGRAESARSDLETCLSIARLSGAPAAPARVRILLARSMARMGEGEAALAELTRIPPDPEARRVRAEILLGQGRAADALEEARASGPVEPSRTFFPLSPGFSGEEELIEDCVASPPGGSSVAGLRRVALEGSALMRLGRQAEAARILHGLVHDPGMRESDPRVHEYLYLFFLALPDDDSPVQEYERLGDRGTVLSRAFKHLQLKASRIDTAEDKNAYMTDNPVNRILADTARTFKFI
jgi:tetratricopeptide (TPR) repeat protein